MFTKIKEWLANIFNEKVTAEDAELTKAVNEAKLKEANLLLNQTVKPKKRAPRKKK